MLSEKYNDYKDTNKPKGEVIINDKNNISECAKINSGHNNKKKRYKTKYTII